MKDLIVQMVCTAEKEEWFNGLCDDRPTETIMNFLINNSIIHMDDEFSWTLSKKVNSKFDLQQMIGSVDSLLTETEERWSLFLMHTYINRQQRVYIKQLHIQSSDKTFVAAQIDFSINYTLIRQREVQQGFFSQYQVILFIMDLTIGQEHRNLAVISDYEEHTTVFVFCAQKRIAHFIKKNFPLVKTINYIR